MEKLKQYLSKELLKWNVSIKRREHLLELENEIKKAEKKIKEINYLKKILRDLLK